MRMVEECGYTRYYRATLISHNLLRVAKSSSSVTIDHPIKGKHIIMGIKSASIQQ
jgi:hypothetical protein